MPANVNKEFQERWSLGYSDFHNLMGFTSKKMPERLIGLLKRCLEGALNNRRFTLGELSTVVAEAA